MLLAYQIGFDLYESATQDFLQRVLVALRKTPQLPAATEKPPDDRCLSVICIFVILSFCLLDFWFSVSYIGKYLWLNILHYRIYTFQI